MFFLNDVFENNFVIVRKVKKKREIIFMVEFLYVDVVLMLMIVMFKIIFFIVLVLIFGEFDIILIDLLIIK